MCKSKSSQHDESRAWQTDSMKARSLLSVRAFDNLYENTHENSISFKDARLNIHITLIVKYKFYHYQSDEMF